MIWVAEVTRQRTADAKPYIDIKVPFKKQGQIYWLEKAKHGVFVEPRLQERGRLRVLLQGLRALAFAGLKF